MKEKIGVYVCGCSGNISDSLDVDALVDFASNREDVAIAKRHKLLCSKDGKEFLKKEIQENGLTRVVIAACTPKQHEATFMKVLEDAGLNPYLMQMANIREQVAWVTKDKDAATEKAKIFINAAINRVALHEPLERKKIDINPNGLIIGGGVAGIGASLLLAQKGRNAILVEKNPSIGGRTVGYEDVFPNLECATCMLEPKLDEVLHNDNIEVLTYSEVEEVLGFYGNFVARIRKKARSVDMEKCIGCAACFEVCPVSVKNKFNEGLNERKAIYVPFAGALPNVPVIDRENCIRFKGEECSACQEACPFDAIDYDEEDEVVEREVGGIVVGTGFDIFDCKKIPNLGYGKYPEVYNSLEFERLLSSTGPTEGKIQMKNGQEPKSVGIIHCVGSRNEKYNKHCSSVCCMYSLKFAAMLKEKVEGIEVFQFYRDFTLPGKGSQQFCDRVKEQGVEFIHVQEPNDINITEEGDKLKVSSKLVNGEEKQISVDMVILSPAIESSSDASKISELLSIDRGEDGFFEELHGKIDSTKTATDGILIAGCAQGPKDIQSSISEGGATAGQILSELVPGGKLELEAIIAEIDEDLCSGCKTCILVCPYKAITYNEEDKVAEVSEVLCKGCGTCVAACPSGAAKGRHFTLEQIFSEISGLISGGKNE
ncbi:MAG: 4Fe-4S binding protein [Elusimicrobiota bacterium]